MGFFSSAFKAVKKAVKQVARPFQKAAKHAINPVASLFGVSSSGGSETVEINQAFAPPIDSPIGFGETPEVGNDTEGHARKKRGKSRLKVATNGDVPTASRGTGLNI